MGLKKGGLIQMEKGPKTTGGKANSGGSVKKTAKGYLASIPDPGFKKGGVVRRKKK